jgi:hypothetical protein
MSKFSIRSTATQLERWLDKLGVAYKSIHADYGSRYIDVRLPYIDEFCKIRISDHMARYDCDFSISPFELSLSYVKKEVKKLIKKNFENQLLEALE